MRYIKTFEDKSDKIEVGDYVIIKNNTACHPKFNHFFINPCEVTSLDNSAIDGHNIKLKCKTDNIWWKKTDIYYHSKRKEDVESILNTRKFNL